MEEKPWYFRKEYVETYEKYYETKYKRASILEKALLKDLLEKYGKIERILEIGCGTCHFTRWFNSLGLYAIGIDISNLMIKEARKYWKGDVIIAESHYLPFRKKQFDVVTFITCLEYMKNVEEIILESARVSKKGIIFGLMNKWSLSTIRKRIQIALGKNPYYTKTTFYSIFSIKKKIKRALKNKFEILDWNTTLFPKIFKNLKSKKLPFGSFLAIGVKIKNE